MAVITKLPCFQDSASTAKFRLYHNIIQKRMFQRETGIKQNTHTQNTTYHTYIWKQYTGIVQEELDVKYRHPYPHLSHSTLTPTLTSLLRQSTIVINIQWSLMVANYWLNNTMVTPGQAGTSCGTFVQRNIRTKIFRPIRFTFRDKL